MATNNVENGEQAPLRRFLPDRLSPEERADIKKLAAAQEVVIVSYKNGKTFIQTQELNPREIGPFNSKMEADEFCGLDPERKVSGLKLPE